MQAVVVPRDSTLGGGNAAAPRASALSTAGHQSAAAPSDPAHVHLTLTGHRLRYFTAILSTVVKMCESVHLEPMQDALLVRAVAPTRTTHLLAVLDSKASFDRFAVHVPWELPDGTPIANSDPAPPTLKLLGKSIAMTALRHGSSTQSLEIRYDAAISHDHVQIIITSQTGLVRNYQLNLQESTNEKAHVDNRFYRFECVADPKTWGSYINSLCPSSGATQGKLAIVPTSSRLVMRAYGAASDGSEMFTGGSTSTSAQNRPTFGSMVSVEQNQFLFYSYPAAAAQTNNNSSTQGGGGRDSTSSLHNAASVCTLPSQPNPTSTTNSGPQVSLPGKSIELKPLRQFLRVCEALGLKTRLMTGVEGIPVFLEGVSKEGEPPVRHLSLLVAALDSNEGNASSSSTTTAASTTATGESAAATSGGEGGVSGVVVGGAGRGSRLSSSSTSGQQQPQPQHQQARDETQHHQVVAPPRRVLTGGGMADEQQPSVVMGDSSVSMHHQRSSSSAISQAPSGTNIGGDSTIMYSLGGGQQYNDASPSVAPRPPTANTRPPTGAPPEVLGGARPQSILRKSGGSGGQQPATTTTTTTSYQPQHQQQGVSSSHPLQNHSETFPHIAEEESGHQDDNEDYVAPSASMGGASSILAPPTPQHQQHGDGRSVSYVPATARSSPGGDFGGRPSVVLDGVGPSQTGSVLSYAASSILAPPSGVLSTSFSQSAARRRQQQRSNNQSQVPSSQIGMASSSESFVPSSQKGPSSQHHHSNRPDLGNVLSSPVKRDDGAQDVPSPVREPYHPHQQQQQLQQRPLTSPQQASGDSYASSSSPSVPISSVGGGVVERLSFGEGSSTATSYPSGVSTTPDAIPSSHNSNIQFGAIHHHHHSNRFA